MFMIIVSKDVGALLKKKIGEKFGILYKYKKLFRYFKMDKKMYNKISKVSYEKI